MRITPHPAKPLIWWYNRRAMIDMTPSYQRKGRLWSASDKAYLVDSIINGFDVPKLYVADFQLGESILNLNKMPYAIIDGKQRLEAIFDFFDGLLVLNEDFVWRQDRRLSLGGLSLKDLRNNHAIVAENFETETVDIMSVVTDSENDINELFIRLNRSKPLTGAEVRNAMVGPVPDIIRRVAHHAFFNENIKFNTVRAGDYNTAAKLILFEYEGKPVGTKKRDLDAFAGRDLIDRDKLELAARRAMKILDDMQEIFLPKDYLLGSAGNIPVYYWLVRESSFESQTVVREFILAFERARKEHRDKQVTGGSANNPLFARFDALNRNTNDIGSYVGRYDILREAMDGFLSNQPVSSNIRFIF